MQSQKIAAATRSAPIILSSNSIWGKSTICPTVCSLLASPQPKIRSRASHAEQCPAWSRYTILLTSPQCPLMISSTLSALMWHPFRPAPLFGTFKSYLYASYLEHLIPSSRYPLDHTIDCVTYKTPNNPISGSLEHSPKLTEMKALHME